MNAITPITINDLNTTVSSEPRLLDIRVAERLGFANPLMIRKLIKRNKEELESHGVLSTVEITQNNNGLGGAKATAFYLNEAQTILVCMFSKTQDAAAVRKEVISVYMAAKNGTSPTITPAQIGGIVKAVVSKQLTEQLKELLPQMVSDAISSDPRIAAVNYRSSLDVVKKLGAYPKGRRNLSRRAGNRLERLSRETGVPVLLSPETGVRLFSAEVCAYWQEQEGAAMVSYHNAAVSGQGILPLRIVL
jgi:hypothetical protein